MLDSIGVWSHAAAAILFAALAIWQMRRPAGEAGGRALALAFAGTGVWSLLVMMLGPHALPPRLVEGARDGAWLAFMLTLLWRGDVRARAPGPDRAQAGGRGVLLLYVVVATIIVVRCGVDLAAHAAPGGARARAAYFEAVMLLRMTTAIGALVLVHNLYTAAAPEARRGIRLPMIALAAIWVYDLNFATIAYLGHVWPTALLALRGLLMVALVPVFALGTQREARFTMRLSRSAAFQSLSLMAIGAYLVAMTLIARVVDAIGGDYAVMAVVTVVFAMSVGALLLLPSRRMQAWLRVTLAKHFFQHRYDYRVEWMRFTGTLGYPHAGAAPLDVRAVQAIAEITESPGGLLLLPGEDGGLVAGSRWRWPTLDVPLHAAGADLRDRLENRKRILAFDEIRADAASGDGPVPGWLHDQTSVWAAVPLVHAGRLVGVAVLARPTPDRTLDWEDFDLLRAAGRQVASYLAEARGQEALSEARRFDEFNRRFAFIMHDVKNLVSQLALLTRNAERHADNPAFRADMIETLRFSTARMNDLLARLSQHHRSRPEPPRPVVLGEVVEAAVAARGRHHPVIVEGRCDLAVLADPARLEQAIGHLLQNAIDASPVDVAVRIRLRPLDGEAMIEVIDRGVGMSAEFIRVQLFKPFASTKEGGFGVGAYEARALIAAMGGRLEVESREGAGSRFAVRLPLADAAAQRPLLMAAG